MNHPFKKQNVKRAAPLFLIIPSLVVLILPTLPAFAVITITWGSDPYSINDGDSAGLGIPIVLTVENDALFGGGTTTISVLITSSVNPTGFNLTLTEDGADNGQFLDAFLTFMDGNDLFTVSDTATITIEDAGSNVDPGAIETLTSPDGVIVYSTSEPGGIFIDIIETGPDSGTFARTLHFSTVASDAATATILVAPGDVVTIVDEVTTAWVNALIIPAPANTGGIAVEDLGTVTATYNGVSASTNTCDCNGVPGRGGGGLVRPGLVLDAILAFNGGSRGDTSPPSFIFNISSLDILSLPENILAGILELDPFKPKTPLTDSTLDLPLLINDKGFALLPYASTIETQIVETGKPVKLKLNLRDDTGIEHIGLYTNLHGNEREIEDSDTYLIYNEYNPLEITDPNDLFSNVNFTVSDYGTKYVIDYDITFAKPMNTSDIIFRVWDEKRNSADIKIFNALEVMGKPLVDNIIQTEKGNIMVPYFKEPKFIMPVADSEGNVKYYNSFGDLEQKQLHPYHAPTIYPTYVGRAERYDDGFQNAILLEDIKARLVADTLVSNPFKLSEDRPMREMFVYPNNVGKLDREDVVTLKETKLDEHVKATKYFLKRYYHNYVED